MAGHTLASSTQTVEMAQVHELNQRLATLDTARGEHLVVSAEFLGLAGARVYPKVVDLAAARMLPRQQRRNETLVLPVGARLQSVLATGDPSFPHLYGVFGEPDGDRRLPVHVHTEQLRLISSVLQLRHHRWGL